LAVDATNKPNGEFDSLIRFNLASAVAFFNTTYGAGAWTVQSVGLYVDAVQGHPSMNVTSAGDVTAIWQANDAWVEGTGTSLAPTTDGVSYATLASLQSGSDQSVGTFHYDGGYGQYLYLLNLTSGLANDMTSGADLSLRLVPSDNNVSFAFFSRDNGLAFGYPQLVVTAAPVPEPSVLALVILGCVGGLAAKRIGFKRRATT
jgi:hypothetical protein